MAIKDGATQREKGGKGYTLKEIVYKYLIEFDDDDSVKGLDFESIMETNKCFDSAEDSNLDKLLFAYETIDTKQGNISKDLADIYRIFRVEAYRNEFMDGVKYGFDEEDADFICELINRYKKNLTWKKFKKVNNNSNFPRPKAVENL